MRLPDPLAGLFALVLAGTGCGDNRGTQDRPTHADAAADALSGQDLQSDSQGDGGSDTPHPIHVASTDVVDLRDGLCSLSEAIAAVNGVTAVDSSDCSAATGNDVIVVPAGIYETLATLELSESVELRGAGMGDSVIAFGGDLACGVRATSPGKEVRLTSLTLRPSALGRLASSMTGICVTAGTVRLRHARVSGFSAGGLRAQGPPGGYPKLEIYNSLVDGNKNRADGGGIAFVGAESSISIDQVSIVNNTSDGMGGGLFAAGGKNANYIFNTTISGNVARRGGGVAVHILDLTYFGLYWSTIVHNQALDVGGGLHVEGNSLDAHGTASDSIVAENSAVNDAAQANLNAHPPPGFSCTSSFVELSGLADKPLNVDDSCRFDRVDLRLGPLMDMGGADHLPVHALLAGSPAIDALDDVRPQEVLQQRDSWNGAAGDPPLGTGPGETARWTLFGPDRDQNPFSDAGAYEYDPRWETELLSLAERAPADPAAVTGSGGFSHGAATRLQAGAVGDFVTYRVPVPESGRHAVSVGVGSGTDAAQFRLLVGDTLAGPYLPVGDVQEGYATVEGARTLQLGEVEFASFGQKFFRFEVAGKNRDSSGYALVLDFLSVIKQ